MRLGSPLALALTSFLIACSSSPGEPPLTDATSLTCPEPGDLPFRMVTDSFQVLTNATIAKKDPRFKDEASDTIGNPGGPYASTFLGSGDAVTTAVDYHGIKARTGSNQGIELTPLVGEIVSAWYYDASGSAWTQIGRGPTDSEGTYDFPMTDYVAPSGSAVYAMLEGDGTCAVSTDLLLGSGSKVVVFDIDGTLTLNNNEFIMQVTDGAYVPKQMGAAAQLAQAWAMKGYPLVYLTARQHLYRAETVAWLASQQFPWGAVITGDSQAGSDPQGYKTVWLERMAQIFGWDIVAAYGNETTDIGAYQAVSIPASETFIVGDPLVGSDGNAGSDVVSIEGYDFTSHISSYVDQQPANN